MAVKTMSGRGPAERSRPGSLRRTAPAAKRVVWVYAITDDRGPREFAGLSGVGGERVRVVADAGWPPSWGRWTHGLSARMPWPACWGGWTTSSGSAVRTIRSSPGSPRAAGPCCRSGWPPSTPTTTRSAPCWPAGAASSPVCSPASRTRWNGGSRCTARSISRRGPTRSRTRSTGVLADIADASQRQPAADPRYVRGPDYMLLNAAYLLRGDRATEFLAAAHALAGARAGVRADLNGPWPPYSFVDQLDA